MQRGENPSCRIAFKGRVIRRAMAIGWRADCDFVFFLRFVPGGVREKGGEDGLVEDEIEFAAGGSEEEERDDDELPESVAKGDEAHDDGGQTAETGGNESSGEAADSAGEESAEDSAAVHGKGGEEVEEREGEIDLAGELREVDGIGTPE